MKVSRSVTRDFLMQSIRKKNNYSRGGMDNDKGK